MPKFYTVRKGHTPGVYASWSECEQQVKGYPGALFKSFPSRELAEKALESGWDNTPKHTTTPKPKGSSDNYIKNSISVDAACSGNPGQMEYQCVDTDTGALLFTSEIYPVGTNNIGEFLGVVDALKYLLERGLDIPVYTDSKSAIAWVRNKRVKTTLARTDMTEELWQAIDAATLWLHANYDLNPVLKWETEHWGESKADFGRK